MTNNIYFLNDSDFNSIVSNPSYKGGLFLFLSAWDSLSAQIEKFTLYDLKWTRDEPIYIIDSFEAPKSFPYFKITRIPALVIDSVWPMNKFRYTPYKVIYTVSGIQRELVNQNHLEFSSGD